MPALQVRDFPQDIYEDLVAEAKLEHRSIAQQTLVFVEQGLKAAKNARTNASVNGTLAAPAEILPMVPRYNVQRDSAESAEARIARRKKIFEELEALNKKDNPWAQLKTSPLEMVRAAREDAYDRLGC